MEGSGEGAEGSLQALWLRGCDLPAFSKSRPQAHGVLPASWWVQTGVCWLLTYAAPPQPSPVPGSGCLL